MAEKVFECKSIQVSGSTSEILSQLKSVWVWKPMTTLYKGTTNQRFKESQNLSKTNSC